MHVIALAKAYQPAGHASGILSAVGHLCPTGQSLQTVVLPLFTLYYPDAQAGKLAGRLIAFI